MTDASAGSCVDNGPDPMPPSSLAWNGETKTGGTQDQISGTIMATAEISCESSHSGLNALKLSFPTDMQDYTGWNWTTPVDITNATNLTFWIRAIGTPPNNFFIELRSVGSGGEHEHAAGLGHIADAPGMNVVAVPNFEDGYWHEVVYPLMLMCGNDEHGYTPYPCNQFDPTQADELVFGQFSTTPTPFVFYIDDIGFE